jgi:hypothetical protein
VLYEQAILVAFSWRKRYERLTHIASAAEWIDQQIGFKNSRVAQNIESTFSSPVFDTIGKFLDYHIPALAHLSFTTGFSFP